MLKIIQLYFQFISKLAPAFAGRQAFGLFQRTRRNNIRKSEHRFYNLSRRFKIPHYLEDIDCYEMGEPEKPMVLLVHGWDSNVGSMAAIAIELVEKGYYVVGFNLPAHGYSKLKKANIKLCREYFLSVVERIYPDRPFSVIAHSFGAAVTSFSLANSRFKVDKIVFLTNPNKFSVVFGEFKKFIKISDKAFSTAIKMAEKLIQMPISEMNVQDMGTKIDFNRILLIHDKHDKVLPYSNSVAVLNKWKNSEIVPIEKIGHYRMLWNEYVINSIVKFLEPAKSVNLNAGPQRMAS